MEGAAPTTTDERQNMDEQADRMVSAFGQVDCHDGRHTSVGVCLRNDGAGYIG